MLRHGGDQVLDLERARLVAVVGRLAWAPAIVPPVARIMIRGFALAGASSATARFGAAASVIRLATETNIRTAASLNVHWKRDIGILRGRRNYLRAHYPHRWPFKSRTGDTLSIGLSLNESP